MKRRTPLLLSLVILSMLFTSSGCRDRVELSQLGVVSALGIDLASEPGQFEVTAQMIRPSGVGTSGGPSAGRPFLIVTTTGHSVFDAIRKATTISSRKLFFSHERVVIIGRALAENGIYPILDLLIRDEEFRPNLKLLVATGTAKEIIYSVSEFESVPGIGLAELLRASSATSAIGLCTLHEFRIALASGPGLQPIASLVDSVTAATIGDERSFVGSRVSPEQGGTEQILRLVGTAIFRDDRMVDTLDLVESRGYRWVTGQVDSGVVNIRMPESGKQVDLEIVAAESKVEAKVKGGQPQIEVLVKATAQVGAQEGSDDLTTLDNLQLVEAVYAAAVQHEIAAVMAKAQLLQTDIFGFGDNLRAKQPKAWAKLQESWPQVFEKLPIEITVKTHVDRYGLISTSNQPEK